ncbi:MAG: hypothetical protein U1E45_20710 [Geminicoccaceae bacterium]
MASPPAEPTLVPAGLGGELRLPEPPLGDPVAKKVESLKGETDRTALRLALLEERVDKLTQGTPAGDIAELRALAASVALLGLQARARSSDPFATDLALARRFIPTDEATANDLATLSAQAAAGVPSVADLELELERLLPLLQTQIEGVRSGAQGRQLVNSVLAAVHLAEPAPADPRREILAAARTDLDRGRLDGAVSALEQLDPPTRAIVSGWLAAAKTRLAVDASVDRLLGSALAQMAAG